MNDKHAPNRRSLLERRLPRWLGSIELSTLIAIVLITAGIWAFSELADAVLDDETRPVDRAILLAMRNPADLSDPIGPRWLEDFARDMTALGGVGVLTFITLSVAGYLMFEHRRDAMVLLIAVASAYGVSHSLKHLIGRDRPDLVPHAVHVYFASFPSGHAMMSAATYLFLGAMLARTHSRWRAKVYFLTLAVVLAVVVGVSRVYLGVHWPTDVLAGWTLGACWAMLCWLVAFRWSWTLNGRKRLPAPQTGTGTPGAS